MRFALTTEQRGFAAVLDDVLAGARTPAVVRDWADGNHAPGLELWRRLADLGLTGLRVPESRAGTGGDAVDLVVAFEALGRYAVPGPWVESVALLPALLRRVEEPDAGSGADPLAGIARGLVVATACAPPLAPYALDADVATQIYVVGSGTIAGGRPAEQHRSLDPARRMYAVVAGAGAQPLDDRLALEAFNAAALAVSAQLLGIGEYLVEQSVGYAKLRKQFGRPIGEYQAMKHALADVRIALDFARPLVYVGALSLQRCTDDATRDVAAAKVAVSDATHRAARTALQVHGAIGYTAEYNLGLWITKARALTTAWGTPSHHRATVLDALVRANSSGPVAMGH